MKSLIIAIIVFLAIMAYAGLQMLLYEPILILIILIAIIIFTTFFIYFSMLKTPQVINDVRFKCWDSDERMINNIYLKKEVLDVLIDVKLADSKAKSIDVYNGFTNIKSRYYQFANLYFKNKVNILIDAYNVPENMKNIGKKNFSLLFFCFFDKKRRIFFKIALLCGLEMLSL